MGYFDGLTDAAFKKDANGKTLFYPWGVLGSGFIIESDEQRNKIRGFYKNMYMITLPAIVIIQITMGVYLNLILFPIYVIWYYFFAKQLARTMVRSSERLTLAESMRNSAKSHNLLTLIFLEITSVGLVAIGVAMLIAGMSTLSACSITGFFGLFSVGMTWMLIAKLKEK